jgi:hypothetical protein
LDSNELFFFSSFSLSSLWISRYHFRNQMCYVTLYLHQFWSLFFLLIFFILIFFKVGLFFNFSLNVLFHLIVFIQFGLYSFDCYFLFFFLILFSISSVNILFHLSFFLSIFSPYSFYFLISCLIILFHLICISNLIFILLIALFNFRWLRILLRDFLIIAFNGVILASLS